MVLRGRGTKGATPDVLHSVVSWARSVREEGTAIHSGRSETSRRQRAEISSDRIARYEMNLSLLNGVLKGAIALNVEENGELVFRHVGTPETPVEAEPPVAENGDA
ncbi:MAG: hypothetical protein SFU56_17285 [Capsulimonadales bacterium]|nr:hypothetical protein [Capsulimonadales bacterium]